MLKLTKRLAGDTVDNKKIKNLFNKKKINKNCKHSNSEVTVSKIVKIRFGVCYISNKKSNTINVNKGCITQAFQEQYTS